MYKCKVCDYTAVQQNHLTTHIYRHHTNKTYRCKYKHCGVKKPSEQELFEHNSTEHPVLRHRCDVCAMSFNRASTLTRHKRIHSELGYKYKCQYCGKRFTRSSHLKIHSLTHTGDKPHKCSVCGKGLAHRSSLTRHMRIHTGEKPFSCSHCDMRFRDISHKYNHEITCRSKTC